MNAAVNAGINRSDRSSYVVSVALHGALLAALLYVGSTDHLSGAKAPAPTAIEILLPPMDASAASAPEAAEKPVERAEKIVPDELPVMPEAVEAKSAPVTVAKTAEPQEPRKEEITSETVETQSAAATPSDAPRNDTAAVNSIGAANAVGGGSPGEADFKATVVAWIEKHKRYPDNARRRGMEGTPHVRFRIDRQGRVLSHELKDSCGQPMLDKAALDTIARASPFPQFPPELEGETIEFTVPLEFSMRR